MADAVEDDELAGGELMGGELLLTGRITTASNATFLGSIGETTVVYKPCLLYTSPSPRDRG